jgi:hypothetical protein
MRLRPDIIKLDRELTTAVDVDPAKAPLISSFVRYARDIGATVCGEGIETLGELRRLADLDVALGQGWAIARPAAPWPSAAEEASAACLRSFEEALAVADDDRLEALANGLALMTTSGDFELLRAPLATTLGADDVRLVGAHAARDRATQLLADDPAADPAEAAALRAAGFASRLTLPIPHDGETIGQLEAYLREPRPWSRLQVGRARVVCTQLAPLLASREEAA